MSYVKAGLLTIIFQQIANEIMCLAYIYHTFLLRYQNKSLHYKIKQYTFLMLHHTWKELGIVNIGDLYVWETFATSEKNSGNT